MTDLAARATTLVELAESEPLLGNRLEPVRAAIDAAARVLDEVPLPELRARIMLRLTDVKLVENDWDGADRALEAVGRHVPDHEGLRFLAGIRACRVGIRRGPDEREAARTMLRAAALKLPDLDDGDTIWHRVTCELVLGVAEVAIHDDTPDPAAFEPLRMLVENLASDPTALDTVFLGRQLLGTYAISIGRLDFAARELRAVAELARQVGSPADEVEARLAIAGIVVEQDLVGREEATRQVQRARELATQHELPMLQQAATLAEAGVLAAAGKTAVAIDRVLDLARSAQAAQDVPRYVGAVGIMAELYARSGDHVSAFRTIAEANHALGVATGSDATPLFRPHLARLRDRIGEERLARIASDVDKANRLATQLADTKSKNPS